MQLEITKSNHTHDAVQQVHRQFGNLLTRQPEEIQRLAQSLKSFQNELCQWEAPACQVLEPLQRSLAGTAGTDMHSPPCVLLCLRRPSASVCLEEVFGALADGAACIGARASALTARARIAWRTSAVGYSSKPSVNSLCDSLRALKGAPAGIETAPGSRYPDSSTEQPAGDEARGAPQQAIPMLLGTSYPGPLA